MSRRLIALAAPDDRTHLRSAKVVDLHHDADGAIRTIAPFIPAP